MNPDEGSARHAGRFRGGIHLPSHKADATASPLISAPVSAELVMPLLQHNGAPARPVVAVGERVLRGQLIAEPEGFISAALHAPTSGTVAAIEARPVAHPSASQAACVVIESDGEDRALQSRARSGSYHDYEPAVVRGWVREAGVVGLGGAGFPASVKLTAEADQQVHTLLLNGAECDPHICCDQMLMQEHAAAIVEGGLVLLHILQVHRCIIAIEDDKPAAIAAVRAAVGSSGDDRFEVCEVPALYPQGGEKQLIQTLSGTEVPADGLPLDVGFVCHNVGTAAAVADAVVRHQPLISRIVTVSGNGVAQPRNLRVRLGTPVAELVRLCGGYNEGAVRLVMGGSMMGFTLLNDEVPVVKATDCILALKTEALRTSATVMPCIRCGECASVCPASLLPQQLHWHARGHEYGSALKQHLFDCIECGCCDYVCPSHIPLTQQFRAAKADIRTREASQLRADMARQRFEARTQRLANKKARDAARRAARKAVAASKSDPQEAVLQAVARAKARRKARLSGTGKDAGK